MLFDSKLRHRVPRQLQGVSHRLSDIHLADFGVANSTAQHGTDNTPPHKPSEHACANAKCVFWVLRQSAV
jgi:hypothetical protein